MNRPKSGYTLLETLISFAMAGIIILCILIFFSGGIKNYMRTVKKPLWQAQETARQVMSGKVGDRRGGMIGEMRKLILLSEADCRSVSFVVSCGERYADLMNSSSFIAGDPIIFDADNNFTYEQGTDTVIFGSAPAEGTPIFEFKSYEKHTDNGNYKFDSGEVIIRDLNDNNLYDTGEPVLSGNTPANGTKVVPFGNTIKFYLDIADKKIKRTENGTKTEVVGKDILVDALTNSFGLKFQYFDTNGDELVYVPLNLTNRGAVCFIEVNVAIDIDNDQKSDFKLKTKVFPRKLMK